MLNQHDLEYAYTRGYEAGYADGLQAERLRAEHLDRKKRGARDEAEMIAAKAEQDKAP